MGYTQVYTESGIPRIWGHFRISKECDDNRQELLEGMIYWSKTNGIKMDIAVLYDIVFANLDSSILRSMLSASCTVSSDDIECLECCLPPTSF